MDHRTTTYTHPDVLDKGVREGWADPQTDPTRIDWAPRQAAAAIHFHVVAGRPVNPCQKTVASGDKVAVTGFGSFEQVHKDAYVGRNPSTGAPVQVPESWTPKFKPGSEFKAAVNEGGRTAKAA